jgi:hypothetical protein
MSPRIVEKSECSHALTEMSHLYVLANPGISGGANQILRDFTTHKTGTVPGMCDEWQPYCDLRPGRRSGIPGGSREACVRSSQTDIYLDQ